MSVKTATVEIEWECDRCGEQQTVRVDPTDTGHNRFVFYAPNNLPDGWGYPKGTEAGWAEIPEARSS